MKLPAGIDQAFQVAAGELGFCSAAWLFVREVAAEGGEALVADLRDRLGRAFPVLDAVSSAWLEGTTAPVTDPAAILSACTGVTRVVVVGIESVFLDRLIPRLDGTRAALLCQSAFDVDWDRALANYEGRIEPMDLESFQSWAGPKSALLTFAYGLHNDSVHILPDWLRVTGEDVRTQFRSLIAWDVLKAPMYVYPRWLVEVPASTFTHIG